MATAIDELHSGITPMNKFESSTPQTRNSTSEQGVPINTNFNIYTTYKTHDNPSPVVGTISTTNDVYNVTTHTTNLAKRDFQQIIYIYGYKFYAFLVPNKSKQNRICLLDSHDYQDGDFIIAMSYFHPGYPEAKPIFTSFRSYLDAYHWINSLPLQHKVVYEVIMSNKSNQPTKQKPHFDVDIHFDDKPDDNKDKFTIDELGSAIMVALPTAINDTMIDCAKDYNRKDHLLIANSNTQDKQSYHVIIRGFCHKDHLEAKAFYDLVKARLPNNLQRYLDMAVYGTKQQFRLLGNHKINKNNVKVFDERLTLWRPTDDGRGHSKEIVDLQIFEEFLVSYTAGCIELPSFITKSNELKIKTVNTPVDLSLYEEQIRALYESSLYRDSGPIRDFANGIINITNSGRFKCTICDKIHENENPYLYVNKGSLFWDCRRHDKTKKSKFIGKITGVIQVDNTIPIIETVTKVNDECEFMGVYCIKHGDKCPNINNQGDVFITETGANKLDKVYTQQQRVQTIPIINGVIPTNNNSEVQQNLINSTQSQGQIKLLTQTTQTYPLINKSTLIDTRSQNNIVYENTSSSKVLINHIVPANKETLEYFIKYHITQDFSSNICISDILAKYRQYCTINSIGCQYQTDDTRHISIDIRCVSPYLNPNNCQIKGVRTTWVKGYKFHNLDFMNVRQDVTRTLNVTQLQPIVVSKEQIKKAEEKQYIENRKDWYDRQYIPRLNGTHEIDMMNRMARMEEVLRSANYPLINNYLLFMKAPCGIGKTEFIRNILRTAPSYLIVVGRILLGRKIENDLLMHITKQMPDGTIKEEWIKEASFYSDIDGKVIRVNKVICTIDSLYRVEGGHDYLILDEFSYTLNQLVGFSKNKRDNACALIERIKRTKNVIVADAYLEQSTIDVVDKIRNRNDKIIYENRYPKHSDKTINEIASPGIYYSIIEDAVGSGINQIIPTGSQETAEAIATNMRDKMGCKLYREDEQPNQDEQGYKVKIYTGKDKKFGDPTVEWGAYNAIVFTSVLEAGNSFVQPHFDVCNAFFTSRSFGPQSAAQMILRCRNYTSGNINILTMEGYSNEYHIPDNINTYEEFKVYILNHINSYRDEIRDGIRLSYIDGIDLTHEYLDLWCDVKYREHMGKKSYKDNLMLLCKSQGMIYGKYIDEEEYKSKTGLLDFEDADADEEIEEGNEEYFGYRMQGVCKRIKNAKNRNRIKKCNDISEIHDITPDEAIIIAKDGNASKGDKLALTKYKLKKRYGIKEDILPAFVDKVLDKSKMHTNVTVFKDLSGPEEDLNERQRLIIKEKIAFDMKTVEVPSTTRDHCLNQVMSVSMNEIPSADELLKSEALFNKSNKNPHVVDRIDMTERMKRYIANIHCVNMLHILGFNKWLRSEYESHQILPFPMINFKAFGTRLNTLKEYANINSRDLHTHRDFNTISNLNINILKFPDKIEEKEDETLSAIRKFINSTLKVFDMKLLINKDKDGYQLKSFWQLDNDGFIRPLSKDPTKQPAILHVPNDNLAKDVTKSPTILNNTRTLTRVHPGIQSNKSTTRPPKEIKYINVIRPGRWDYNNIKYVHDDPPDQIKAIAHTPPIGACVHNNIVQTQAPVPPKIVPVPIRRRIPVMPIIANDLKLARVN